MNYSWSRNQTTMLYAHLGNDYVKALIMRNLSFTPTHFDFTTLGGPGFFGMPPIWSRRERQTTLTKLWGTFTAIFNQGCGAGAALFEPEPAAPALAPANSGRQI